MSTDRDTARIVRSWLEEGATALPDRVLDAVLDQVPATSQRRPLWPARRFREMNNGLKLVIAAAAVVVVAIVGINLLPRSGGVGGTGPSPTANPTPAPGALASPVPLPTVYGVDIALTAGRYYLTSFPVGITFEVPAQSFACSLSEVEQTVCAPTLVFGFVIVDNVVADPCSAALLDPPIGPSVDELITALSNLEGFEATAPLDVSTDGFDGKQFTLTAPQDAACDDMKIFATANRTNGVGPGEVNLLRILDVNGTRVVIGGAYEPGTSAEGRATFDQVIASMRFEPRPSLSPSGPSPSP